MGSRPGVGALRRIAVPGVVGSAVRHCVLRVARQLPVPDAPLEELGYDSRANLLPCMLERSFRFRAHTVSRTSAAGRPHEALRRKAKEAHRTKSFVDMHQREVVCLTDAGARARFVARPTWWDERMWVAPGLLTEGNPFMAYFSEEIRANQRIAWLFMVAERVIIVAKCWLRACIAKCGCTDCRRTSARPWQRSIRRTRPPPSPWGRARNVRDVRSLAIAHNHLDLG